MSAINGLGNWSTEAVYKERWRKLQRSRGRGRGAYLGDDRCRRHLELKDGLLVCQGSVKLALKL